VEAIETDLSYNECKDKINKSGAGPEVVSVGDLIFNLDSYLTVPGGLGGLRCGA
jgi:hypothetical protein